MWPENPGELTFPELDRAAKKHLDKKLKGAGFQRRTLRRDHGIAYFHRNAQKWMAGLEFYADNTLEKTVVVKTWPLNRLFLREFQIVGTAPIARGGELAFQFRELEALDPWLQAVAEQCSEPLLRRFCEVVDFDFSVREEMLAVYAATYQTLGFQVSRGGEGIETASFPSSPNSLEPCYVFEFIKPGHRYSVLSLIPLAKPQVATYRVERRGRAFEHETLHGLETNYCTIPKGLASVFYGRFQDLATFRERARLQAERMMAFLG